MSIFSKAYFHNEEAAFAHLESVIWPHGPVCPHCGNYDDNIYDLAKTRLGLKKCGSCRKQFTVRVGTVFESSHVPLHKWLQCVYLMCSSKKGISSHQLHRILEVTYKTAWFMSHRIREAMRDGRLPPMGGEGQIVEADETYYGNPKGSKRSTTMLKDGKWIRRGGGAHEMKPEAFNKEKFKSLVHYVIWKASARPNFGATKLYKIAWFSDAKAFMLTGHSITGAEYIREKYGPIPRLGKVIRDELEREGAISQWRDREYNYPSWKFKPRKRPDVSAFNSEELKTIDWWIDHISNDHTAESASELSHDYGWEIASIGETLPFHAFLAERVREPTESEMEWARRRARELNLE